MEQSIFIRRKYHRTLNTYHLFESFLYTEFYSKISEVDDNENLYIEGLKRKEEYINLDFINELFDEIWRFSEQIDINPRISEDFIYEILTSSNDNEDFYKLTKEFDLFDFDYKTLEEIKDYCINIIKEHGDNIKMKHFIKNYNTFLKGEVVSRFRINLLVAEDNLSLN